MRSLFFISLLIFTTTVFSKDYYAFKCIDDQTSGECVIPTDGFSKMQLSDDGKYYGVIESFGMIASTEQFDVVENVNGTYQLSATGGNSAFLAVPTAGGLTGIITVDNLPPTIIPRFNHMKLHSL